MLTEHYNDVGPNDQNMPPQLWVEETGGPFWQLHSGAYLDDVDVYDCAGLDADNNVTGFGSQDYYGGPHIYSETNPGPNGNTKAPYSNRPQVISGVEFAHDIGRVDKNSDSRRVVAGTFQDILVEYYDSQDLSDGVKFEYDAPYDGGALVLHFDNAVGWAPEVKPEERWIRNNLTSAQNEFLISPGVYKTRFVEYGYVPNPRMDEDQPYDPTQTNLATDNDDIYVIECDTDGNPVTYDTGDASVRDIQGKDQYGDCPGWISPVGEYLPGFTPWRPNFNMGEQGLAVPNPYDLSINEGADCKKITVYSEGLGKWQSYNKSTQWIFPQRGPYAGEIRWNKHDSRLIAGTPFYRGGGMGYKVDKDDTYGLPD